MNVTDAVKEYRVHDKACVESIRKAKSKFQTKNFRDPVLLSDVSKRFNKLSFESSLIMKRRVVKQWSSSLQEDIIAILQKSIKTITLLEDRAQNSYDIEEILFVAKRLLKLRSITTAKIYKLDVVERKRKIKKYLIR